MEVFEDFNDGENCDLAFKMRSVNPEQFSTLVKMHLSFELDLQTEENDGTIEKSKMKKWSLLSFARKPKVTLNGQKGVESTALSQDRISQIKHLVNYLSQEQCIKKEGIFRRTGKLTRQQELKNALFQGSNLNLDDALYSVHDCASVLKSYLAELPEPLLTDLHYPAHCQIAEMCDNDKNECKLLRALQLLLLLLPYPNRILLKEIMQLLNKTAAYEHSNKMNCDNLATLFTPHLVCPRKLSPEALHVNSQNLSGLVAFMIKKGLDLFDVPSELAVDIKAYWMEKERKLLSPQKKDLNESTSDTTGTARTVFSFVDHKLTAEAAMMQDTQFALAHLYATIQGMPESAKKKRLMKQLSKENAILTPRSTKNCRTKSLGDSIKKHIFQKKLLGSKIKIGCTDSEDTFVYPTLEKGQRSKSDDELSIGDRNDSGTNLLGVKPISISTDSIQATLLAENFKPTKKNLWRKLLTPGSENSNNSSPKKCSSPSSFFKSAESPKTKGMFNKVKPEHRISDEYTELSLAKENFVRGNLDPSFTGATKPVTIVRSPIQDVTFVSLNDTQQLSPPAKKKLARVTHTSTPADLLRRNLAVSDYMFTPIARDDKSMSPITQSASKMTKAMQETMMTPRSRKPVMIISNSNISDLSSLNEDDETTCVPKTCAFQLGRTCASIIEESLQKNEENTGISHDQRDMENFYNERNFVTSVDDDYHAQNSVTNNFHVYFSSRSVLTASPVDLSFSSRTDDYEQSESDALNEEENCSVYEQTGSDILNKEEDALSESLLYCLDGNNPESDTSGIGSRSTYNLRSADNSNERRGFSVRKRGTSLQRNDSKRAIKEEEICTEAKEQKVKRKPLSESNLKPKKKELSETSF